MEPEVIKPEPTAEERAAEVNVIIKKMYIFVHLVEKMYCTSRDERKQFRQDVIKNGFLHADLMKKFLTQRELFDTISEKIK